MMDIYGFDLTSNPLFFWKHHFSFLWGTSLSFRDGHISHPDLANQCIIHLSSHSGWLREGM